MAQFEKSRFLYIGLCGTYRKEEMPANGRRKRSLKMCPCRVSTC